MDVAAWLRSLGLERYEPLFRDNEIDWQVLPKLSSDDLKEIGVTAIGHRRKLLDALAALNADLPASVSATPRDASSRADAERRQLTVMFCDLVGSTALSTRHDPEDLRELIGGYHRAVSEAVGHFDGFVAKYMGDGVLIYFGYPQAHEDDAERAVRAGLAAIAAVGQLPGGTGLRVRLGIATGLAVVGDLIGEGAAQERGVVGETPNLAARLQALAMPDTLVIADATRRQIGGLFDLEDLGPRQLAGFAEPQRAWRVLGESGAVSRFEALRSGETPLVGREEEVELLLRRWQQAKSGEGRVVLISGEPGIGKSRLTAALSEHIAAEPHTRLRYFCSPHHQDSALYPFIAHLERAAGFARDDAVEAKLGKLWSLTPGAPDAHDLALLSELLSLPSTAADLNLSPQRKREKLFEALLNQLDAEARRRPVLMVFEDAHWIDPTSRELLDLAVDRVRRLPVLLAITFRPEFQPPWAGRAHVTSLALNRLGEREGEAMVHTLAGNAGLTAEIVGEIVERTDGVPLFVEELTKAVLESAAQGDRVAAVLGTSSPAALAVPATLHASLMARLDRLGPMAKEIAQIGAVLGREFAYELIEPVAQHPERELQAALDRLGDAGLLFCRGSAPHSTYLFKHALVQDAAYSTLLRERRKALHARIVEVLESQFAEISENQPQLLAHHYTEAGLIEEAADLWGKAGQQSLTRSALIEAVAQFTRALAQIAALPATAALRRDQIELQVGLASALIHVKGYAAPEAKSAFREARWLIEQAGALGEPPDDPLLLFSVLYGFFVAAYVAFNGDLMRELAAEFLAVAEQQAATGPLIAAHRAMGITLEFTGDIAEARAHFTKVLALYDPAEHRPLATRFGADLRVGALSFRSTSLWLLGYAEAAQADIDHAVKEAREIGQAATLMMALGIANYTNILCGNYVAANALAQELVDLADEKGASLREAEGMVQRGCALALTGRAVDAVEMITSGVTAWRSTGATCWTPLHMSFLARAYAALGQFDDAWRCIGEARAVSEETKETWCDADVHRLAGEIVLASGEPDAAKAEAYFERALAVARRQQAKSFELRAAISMARLWQGQGKRDEAHDLLAPVYGWFTEGFDTADLKEAKALLAELAPHQRVA